MTTPVQPQTQLLPATSQKLEQLTEEELLKKVADYKALLQRMTADYQNLQKDTDRRLDEMRKFATAELVLELCPLVDYFDSAFAAIPETERSSNWLQGIKHIQDYLLRILQAHQVIRITTVGQIFDPNVHEAAGEEPSAAPEHSVVRELQAGFTLNGKVIRPAKVITAINK